MLYRSLCGYGVCVWVGGRLTCICIDAQRFVLVHRTSRNSKIAFWTLCCSIGQVYVTKKSPAIFVIGRQGTTYLQ